MESPVVDVRAHGLAVALLLVTDEVLCTSLDSSVLHASDGVGHGDTCEIRVCCEPLPVAAAVWDLTKST
jgi:hypothetical protein